LPLAESLMLAAIHSLEGDEALTILHGDTLFLGLKEFPLDALSAHRGARSYPWAAMRDGGVFPACEDDRDLVSGLFRFSRGVAFLKCLAAHKTDFLAALNAYRAQSPGFRAEESGQWLDLGHLNTYYDSRRALTTERAFNSLSITKDAVCKTSALSEKIEAEAAWFEAIPPGLRGHVPAYLGRVEPGANRAGYSLAYEYLCPLSDLYVFGAFAPAMWRRILSACGDTLALMRSWKPGAIESGWFAHLYEGKAVERYCRFAAEAGFDPAQGWTVNGRAFPSPLALIEELAAHIGEPGEEDAGVLHGDFCFSNILFDFRRGGLKMIDPRGYAEPGRPGIYGDTRYDLGKLHHSVVGRYDFIVAGYYELDRPAPDTLDFHVAHGAAQDAVEAQFREVICGGDPERERLAAAISVLLFFSMLPLHAENRDRQWAFLANGYRLYHRYFGEAA
ncbi:MAG TPA: phosphotransferase, partial [Magnetospirillaceae bacterium]|nr:phosphotransferase [Magnetospirillaceae bacterium]